jgi:diguanylate cyclase (GGDEF)-like protein/PAS domain S-box-containing protein
MTDPDPRDVVPGAALGLARTAPARTTEAAGAWRPHRQRTGAPPEGRLARAIAQARRLLLGAVTRPAPPCDVTTNKAQRLAARSDDRFQIVFEHSLEGLMTLQPSGVILSCNRAAAQVFGVDAEALVGTCLSDRLNGGAAGAGVAGLSFPTGSYEAVACNAQGFEFPLELTVRASFAFGEPQLVVVMRDVTERKATQDRLAYLANYDSLTGLPNRAMFRDRLASAMKRAKRSGKAMSLMFLDLDRFKDINDSLGHAAGDLLLQYVSNTLTTCLRNVDSVGRDVGPEPFTLARLGGDEFTIIVENIEGPESAALIARRILDALIPPIKIDGQEVFVSTSIGISLYPLDDTDFDGLIRHTDMAMYRSKSIGRGNFSFYDAEMSVEVENRLSLEAHLRHALEREEFELYYQPKADLKTGRVTGVEALIRWNRPGEGMVPPDRFVTMLEDTGLILPVGAWVIRTTCMEVASWERLGLPPLTLAVNLSARQFRHKHLIQLIGDMLLDCGLSPQRLELEINESQLMEDNAVSQTLLASLAELGVRVAIDDFGTGHSSLGYLKRFSIDTLKIDRSFVREITTCDEDNAIATAVIALGHSLGLKVVAEGVETLHQADRLRALGCNEIQCYLLSRPLPARQLVDWLTDPASTHTLLLPRHGRSSRLVPLTLDLAAARQ